MNWTTAEPVNGVKYIVETSNGSIFPAHIINGTWWNSEKAFPIEGVRRWILYPDGGSANDEIPVEILFKYVCRDFKEMKRIAKEESEKVVQLKRLNKALVSDCGKLCDDIKELKEAISAKNDKHQKELENLYELMRNIARERDELNELVTKAQSQPDSSSELLRENKQMKAFLGSIMNTCDIVRGLGIA